MLILSTLAGWLELGIQRWTDTFCQAPPGRLMLLSSHFRGEEAGASREVRSPVKAPQLISHGHHALWGCVGPTGLATHRSPTWSPRRRGGR